MEPLAVSALRQWVDSLRNAPAGMTAKERIAFALVFAVAAISRWIAVAASPWDWDEALFMLALRDYDVAAHHPHPPGFPLFIAAARLVQAFGVQEFRALQGVSVLASFLVVPAVVLFAREFRIPFDRSLPASLLMAFFPNVWFFGGAALSDVPSIVLCLFAGGLLLRGVRSTASLWGAALAAGCAIAVRPQNLLVLALPALVALLIRRRAAIGPLLLAAAVVVASYGAAAIATGSNYADAVVAHQRYIRATDSFLSPARPSLVAVFDDFFVRPFRQPALNVLVTSLAILGMVAAVRRRAAGVLLAVAAFAPFCVFALLFLDFNSASRFAIGYMPLFAFLAAEALVIVGPIGALAAAGALAAGVAAWLLPGLVEVHRHDSPPAAAFREIVRQHDASTVLYVDEALAPFAAALAPGYPVIIWKHEARPVPWTAERSALFIEEGRGERVARRYTRAHQGLRGVARNRYFDVSVETCPERVTFDSGWYPQEGRGADARRWMTRSARVTLPPLSGGGRLALGLLAPAGGQSVEIRIGGKLRERVANARGYVDREFEVDSRGPVDVTIVTDRPFVLKGDTRILGLRLEWLEWSER